MMKKLYTKPYANKEDVLTSEERARYLIEYGYVKDMTHEMLVRKLEKLKKEPPQ